MPWGPDIFSDIFARRDDRFTRLDPRLKLIAALITIGCIVLSKNFIFPFTIFIVCFIAMLAVRIPISLLALRMVSPLGIIGVLIIMQSAMTEGTRLWLLDLHFFKIYFSKEGLIHGLLLGVRALGAINVILFLSFVTPAHQIFRSLRCLHVPKGWVEIATLMYRYLFTLLDLVGDMTAAQRLRLGYLGLRRSLRSAGIVAGTIIIKSMDQAVHTHEAMMLRGYHGSLFFGSMPLMSYKDRCALAATGVLIIGLYLLCERRFA
jgi:cobalt/nickel transport system permease protein